MTPLGVSLFNLNTVYQSKIYDEPNFYKGENYLGVPVIYMSCYFNNSKQP